jgi:Secretion system C-terminal sorting domain
VFKGITLNFVKNISNQNNMKKQLLFIALALSSMTTFAQSGVWAPQATGFTPVSSGVRNISVVDTNIVWISSYDGSGGTANRQDFSMTTNGGANWTAGNIPAPVSHDWSMIFGLSASTAWACFYNADAGARGQIWKTIDGGSTWNQQGAGVIFNAAASFPNVVHFWDDSIGVSIGDPTPGTQYEIYTTTDGGTNWNRVPALNIPAATAGEFGIVAHYNVIGDTIWFDTNKGRIYRSIDRGLNWTVSSTGLVVPTNGAIDQCMTDHLNGIARLYTATTGVSTSFSTSDGGDTWTSFTPLGNLFGSDIKHVPGVPGMMVSTGADATNGFTGSSYSVDGGLNWLDIDLGTQRSALGIADSLTMWSGGFTVSPIAEGIFKYVPGIDCADPLINPGTAVSTVPTVCPGENAEFTATGVYAPTVGDFAGVSWIISSDDISGSADPIAEPSLIATYTFSFPAPETSIRTFSNDGTLIDGLAIPYGIYYWTPVVFGNATSAVAPDPAVFLGDLTLDPSCTFTGTSIPVVVYDGTDPSCVLSVSNIDMPQIALYSTQQDANTIALTMNAVTQGKAIISMFDISGRLVNTQTVYVTKGSNREMINVANLASGTYMIKAEFNGTQAQTKVVKF